MKALGTTLVALVVSLCAFIFLVSAYCAVGPGGGDWGTLNTSDRGEAALFALASAGIIATGIWIIGKLNRRSQ